MNSFFACLLLILSLFVGCKRPSPHIKTFRIGFSQCCDDPWRDVMEQEMYRELAFHPELEFQIRIAENNSKSQIEQIRELASSGIDLLIVSPNESKPLTPVIEEVYKMGIPVILIDRKTDSEAYTAYIGADNVNIGETAAHYIANQVHQKGSIIELQLGMTMTPAQERSRGFHQAILAYPEMQVDAKLEMTSGLPELKELFVQALKQHPKASIVFAHNDFLAENAYAWAQEQGKAADLFFIGIDGIPGIGKGIQAVEDGALNASLLYPTGGAEAIRLALSILNNLPYDKQNLLETIVINSSNARILRLQMKKVESLQRTIDGQLKAIQDLSLIYRNQRFFIFILVLSLLLAMVLGGVLFRSLRTKVLMNRILEEKNREVLEHEHQIMEMSDQLKVATQAKVDFFTNISHEFRTPLTLILGHVEGLLASGFQNVKEAKQDLQMTRKNALRLLRLVNQLMDLRKIESNKMAVCASENDLIGFSSGIVQAFKKVAEKRHIKLALFTADPSIMVWFDLNMMDKVLFNLLSNAFKFTQDGGKIMVSVLIDRIGEKAVVRVEDTGSGMTKEEMDRVFEPFYQGEKSTNKGTGLGLSLSQELVNLHGGSIDIWSEKGRGTRFEVSLPLGNEHFKKDQLLIEKMDRVPSEEHLFLEEGNSVQLSNSKPSKSAEYTLLIVEDEDDLRFFLKKHFEKSYGILEASDGIKGMDAAFEEVPDLILLDVMLPGKDGLSLAKEFKSDLRTSHIPIVMLTARSAIEQKIEGIQSGVDAYVTKPFNLTFLSEVIKNLLRSRDSLREIFSGGFQPGKLPAGMNDLDQEFLRKFIQFIEANYSEQDLTVERLSEEFHLSRVQLYRKVKALLGEGVNDYIQHIRLKKASHLLLETQYTVAEIAYMVGYSSPGYFATAFKRKYSCSPTEYKSNPTG